MIFNTQVVAMRAIGIIEHTAIKTGMHKLHITVELANNEDATISILYHCPGVKNVFEVKSEGFYTGAEALKDFEGKCREAAEYIESLPSHHLS